MSSNLHTLTVAHNESQLVVLWSQQLQHLCRVLDAAAQSGRKFTNERYAHFLEDLRRIGIIYDKNSNVFVFQPTAAEWCELAVDESASERTRQDAIRARFTFYQNLPAADPGRFFNDCAKEEDEQALAAALVYLKNFKHEYEQPLIDTHRYNPTGIKMAGATKTILSTVERLEAYQEKVAQQQEAQTLEKKLAIQKALITRIRQDLASLDPSLRLKVESALKTVENTIQNHIEINEDFLTNHIKAANVATIPVLDNIDKLSSVLVDLMKKQDEVSLIDVSMIAITLEEEVLKAQRKSAEDDKNKIATENSLLIEEMRHHTDSLQKIEQTISEIEKRSEMRQKLATLPTEIGTLSQQEEKAREILEQAERNERDAERNYTETQKKRDTGYQQIEAIKNEIADINHLRKDIAFSIDQRKGEINTTSDQLNTAKHKKTTLNPQSIETAKKELKIKIDTLIQNHSFLDNSFWGTVWLFRGARKSAAHKYLAEKLAAIKSALNQAKTHEEILIQATALNEAIGQAQGMPSQEGGWKKNDNRTHRLEAVQKQYTSYKEKRTQVEAVEKEIEKLADTEQSLQTKQTQDQKTIESLNEKQGKKEAAMGELQQIDQTLQANVRDAFSIAEAAKKSKTEAEQGLHQISTTVSEKKAELSQIQATLAPLPDQQADDRTLAQANQQSAEIKNLMQGLPEKIQQNEEKIAQAQAKINEMDDKIRVCQTRIADLQHAKGGLAQGKTTVAVTSSAAPLTTETANADISVERKKLPRKKTEKALKQQHKMDAATQDAHGALKPSIPAVPLDAQVSHNPFAQFHHHETDASSKRGEGKLVQPVGGHR